VRIAPAVLNQAHAWPGLTIRLLVGTDAEVSDWVANGAADLGLTYDTDLGEAVLEDHFHGIATRRGGTFGAGPIAAGDFAGLPFIMPASGCEPMIRRLLDAAGVAPHVVLAAHDTATLFALVGAGHGVSLVPGLCFPPGWQASVARHELSPVGIQPLRLIGSGGIPIIDLVAGLIRRAAAETEAVMSAHAGSRTNRK